MTFQLPVTDILFEDIAMHSVARISGTPQRVIKHVTAIYSL